MSAIELRNVTKTYLGTTTPAVNNLSLSIEEGSITTLLGPSGCGKSTTLRLIAGFERADAGSILLGGKVMSDTNKWIPPEKRGIGMVFQDYALFPHLNVFKNIGFGYKGNDKSRRIKEIINLVNLDGFEKRFPNELSGGQQQRVALGRALANRPLVVLLDEPFSNLDADLRVQMRIEVQQIIREAGATAIFVSHDQKDALAISDKIVVINNGAVQQIGSPRVIYQFPNNEFVAKFVGQTNILKGIIGKDQISAITDIGQIPCYHNHGHAPGTEVTISIRPDSFELDRSGSIEGTVLSHTYTGESIDVKVSVENSGNKTSILAHMHPEKIVQAGDKVRFRVLPNFVAVIKNE